MSSASITTMTETHFAIPRRSTEVIQFTLDGPDPGGPVDGPYTWTPQKRASLIVPMIGGESVQGATYEWLRDGLPENQRDRIAERLADPKDHLDWDTIGKITDMLADKVSGNRPTT